MYVSQHTCSIDLRAIEQRQASSKICEEFVKHKFSDIAMVATRLHDIINELWNSYGVYRVIKKLGGRKKLH